MNVEMKYSGLERAISKLEKYYGKVISSNEATGKFARDLILSRVSKGQTISGRQMKYKGSSIRRGKSYPAIGDYSNFHGNKRRNKGLSTSPMDLKFSGDLYKAFSYRQSRTASQISLRLYFRNTSTKHKNYNKTHKELADILSEEQGDGKNTIFYPSFSEISQIKKFYKNSTR
jgi:hypothetical protein